MILVFFSALALASPSPDFFQDLETFKQLSPSLRAEGARLSAESTTKLSRALQLTPSLSLGLGKTESKLGGNSGTSRSNSSYWRANADWNLFRGFGDYHAWKAAGKNEEAQSYSLRSQELNTELEGARLIFNRLYLQDVRLAQEELLKLKQETLRIGQGRYAQGKIPLQEVTKMEVDLSQQKNVLRQSEIDLAQNELSYRSLFVDEIKTKSWPLAESQGVNWQGGASLAVKKLESKTEALEQNWQAGKARHLPSLDLSVSYKEYPLKNPTTSLSGSLELSFPLWSRFETSAANAQAYADFASAEADSLKAKREEGLRREFLQKKIEISLASAREARTNLEKSDRLYRDMLRSFQLGRLSTNDLFTEQSRKINSLLSYTQSRLSFHESLMEACVLWGLSARDCLH